jgi:hypothetical protein
LGRRTRDEGARMKRRWIQAVVYAFADFVLWGYLDALSHMEPMTPKQAAHYLPAIHAAQFGMILLVAACVVSLFSTRYGAVCGLAGCISAAPIFARLLLAIPWSHFFEVSHYGVWPEIYASTFAWVIASVYSATQIGLLIRRDPLRRVV